MIDENVIKKTAALAMLNVSEDEQADLADQLNKIVSYVEHLQEVDTTGVEPTAYVVPSKCSLRDDVAKESLTNEEIFLNAPVERKGHFAIPKVIG